MPAIQPRQLVATLMDAFQQSDYSAVLLGSMRTHPRKFLITSRTGVSNELWIYAWTLTFGGRPSLPGEYRIQMTTVSSPLSMNPHGSTLLIGIEPNLGVFGGFDLRRHREFTSGSPSVQIAYSCLQNSLQYGMTFNRKSNDEIAVGIRPDQLAAYALNADSLHSLGRSSKTFDLLVKATEFRQLAASEIDALTEERRKIVRTVVQLSRKASFRQQVVNAYGNRCAVTRMQLRLVDAAHIVPVGAIQSSDHVTNGIALSPTYHRAFDNALIYLDEEHVMRINPAKETELASLNLNGGIDAFKSNLGKILLPQDQGQWPKREFINKANAIRMVA